MGHPTVPFEQRQSPQRRHQAAPGMRRTGAPRHPTAINKMFNRRFC